MYCSGSLSPPACVAVARVQPPVQSTEPTGIAPLQPDEPTEIRDSVLGWVPHHQQPPADKGMIADALYQALYRVVTDGNNRPDALAQGLVHCC